MICCSWTKWQTGPTYIAICRATPLGWAMAKYSDKPSSLHHKHSKRKTVDPDNPYQHIPQLWEFLLKRARIFFENCKDLWHAMLLVCPHSLVCCNPIPKKGFVSLGVCVPWCPWVSHGCCKPIKCCSGVPFPPDCRPAFSLSTPSSSPTKHWHCINCGYIIHPGLLRCRHHCHGFLVMNCVIWPRCINERVLHVSTDRFILFSEIAFDHNDIL